MQVVSQHLVVEVNQAFPVRTGSYSREPGNIAQTCRHGSQVQALAAGRKQQGTPERTTPQQKGVAYRPRMD